MNVAHFHDKFKPNHILEEIIRPPVTANPNIPSKTPVQPLKVIQKGKVLYNETNQQAQRIAVKREFKHPMQKPPAGIKKVASQKKILATKVANQTLKKKVPAQLANFKQTLTPKLKKVPNKQIERNILQKVIAAQKTKVENVSVSTANNNLQETDNSTVINTQNASPKDTNSEEIVPQENVPAKTKSAQDVLSDQNTTPVIEENQTKAEENHIVTPNMDKESSAPPAEKQEPVEAMSAASEGDKKKQLDPLLERAVEDELQDIMIQVWQELPDDPVEVADRMAVEMLRNEAGDDLRRVLGLNITKRLLNVFNNLFVKVQFTCRPQMGCLTSFLNEYRINKFKRIDQKSNTFAAQMETIEDFDKLCAVKEVMCGEAKVIVTPCYKFTQCPETLKTIYDDTFFCDDRVQKQTETLKSQSDIQKTKIPSPNNKVTILEKEVVSQDLISEVQKPQVSKQNFVKAAMNVENNEVKCEAQNVKISAPSENITTPANTAGDTEEVKATTINESVTKSATNAESIGAKVPDKGLIAETDNSHKDSVNVKFNPTPIDNEKTCNTAIVDTKETKCKENKVINVKVAKKYDKDILKDEHIKDIIIKDILENEDIDEFDASVPESEMECDDEELNDEDILALMSEGVVLDECTGSENET